MKKIILISLIVTISIVNYAQTAISSVQPITSNQVGLFEKYEVGIELNQTNFNNVFDPEEIDISVEFTSPSNQIIMINAFYKDEFKRNPLTPNPTIIPNNQCDFDEDVLDPNYLTQIPTNYPWRVRFAPTKIGSWIYRINVKHNDGNTITSTWSTKYSFNVVESSNKGFIKIADNKRNFIFDNGSMFFPIGMNLVHYGGLKYNRLLYTSTIDRMNKIAEKEGNFARIWMSPRTFGIEWDESGVNNYSARQNRAFDLDDIIENSREKNMYIQLCLNSHFEFWNYNLGTWWLTNPYKTLLNGNQNQNDFFTDANCIKNFKKKMRYVIARWGYSTNIVSYELFNEVEQYRNGETPGFWDNNNSDNVINWHKDVIKFMKSLDNNHLYTTSVAFAGAGSTGGINGSQSLFALPEISYTQDHYYEADLNTEFQKNYLALRSISLFDKPNILGEFGEGSLGFDCWTGETNFTSNQYTQGNFFHDVTLMHNGLWSTSFSGAAGAGMYWWSNHIFNPCWGGQWKYFQPLKKFLENENFANKPYKVITNSCIGQGIKDVTHLPTSVDNCVPFWNFQNIVNNPPPDPNLIPNSITTTNDEKIEVFALKSEEKIIGWIHNKENYWYNLPHGAGPNTVGCNSLNDNQPSTFSSIPLLQNETITIPNMQCDGIYKVEFFSTYPEYDINNDNVNDNGGLIPSLTINNIAVNCNSDLTFEIPKMLALSADPPYAPDYGFKITQVAYPWSHFQISSNTNEKIGGDIASGSNNIFYQGTDNRLHHYYYGNLGGVVGWHHEWLTNWSNTSQNINGDLAYEGTDVFYRGTDSRLHHYYYGNLGGVTGWHHEWLTNWSNNSQNVGGDIAYTGTDVFYNGNDSRLHHYYYGNLGGVMGWHHEWLTDWSNNSQNVGGNIQISNGGDLHVFYKGSDSKLHHFYYANLQWNHIWHTDWNSNAQDVLGDIGVSANGQHIFYKGVDLRLHQYYYDNGQWSHTWHTDWNSSSQNVNGEIAVSSDGTHVFYRGNDDYIHQQYYIGNSIWGHDWIICYGDLDASQKANSKITTTSDKVYYWGLDNYIHSFEYNVGCNPRPLTKIQSSNFQNNNNSNSLIENNLDNAPYPNPFNDKIELNNNGEHIFAQLINIFGEVIKSENVKTNKITINTSSVSSGVYFLKVYNQKHEYKIYKLVK